MKALFAVFSLALALTASAQHDVAPADALKSLNFMVGDWTGKQEFLIGTNLEGAVVSNVHLSIGGRFLEESLDVTMPNGKTSDTRHFTTYDPTDKKYHAWWFNGSSYGVMEFTGDFDGKNLVMVSKPVKMGGHTNTFRVTYEDMGAASYGYGLEFMNEDTPWTKQFHTVYNRK